MKETKITAYERRRINSQKIAQVQFTPHEPNLKHQYSPSEKHEWQTATEKKNVKPVWTAIDQAKENELWDE